MLQRLTAFFQDIDPQEYAYAEKVNYVREICCQGIDPQEYAYAEKINYVREICCQDIDPQAYVCWE